MPLPQTKPQQIEQQIQSLASRLTPDKRGENSQQLDDLLDKLMDSLQQLSQVIVSSTGQQMPTEDYTEIGDYAMQILAHCVEHMTRDDEHAIGLLAVSITLWVTDQGGEINKLEPVVDTLAWLANVTKNHEELAKLSSLIGQIIDACNQEIRSDQDKADPGRPWRVININRGIVATRSHDPDVMDAAFQVLIKNLPQDAPAFFTEGMAEIEHLGYPDHVREVMERYYEQWNEPHIIH